MKKLLSVLIVTAMISANASIAMAKGNEKSNSTNGRGKVQIEQTLETGTATEENINEGQEIKVQNREEIKTKIIELKSRIKDLKDQIEAVKEQFKAVRNNKEARKEILAEIAKMKKEANDTTIGVFVRGKDVKFDVPPVIKGGRTLIPVRAVVNALGAKVEWDEATRTVTIIKEVANTETNNTAQVVIKLQIDSAIATVDGKEVQLDCAAEINNSRTIVPLRFIAETFGLKVDWDEESSTVIVEDEAEEDGQTTSDSDIASTEEGPQADGTTTTGEITQTEGTAPVEGAIQVDGTTSDSTTTDSEIEQDAGTTEDTVNSTSNDGAQTE